MARDKNRNIIETENDKKREALERVTLTNDMIIRNENSPARKS